MITPVFASTAEQTVQAYIPVTCVAKNTTESFVYHLESDSTEYQTIVSDTLSLEDGDNENFVITYTCLGTYSYQVYPDVGSDKDTTYDKTSYRVFVYVFTDETNALTVNTVAYADSSEEKASALTFTNVKTKTESPKDDNGADVGDDDSEKDANKYGEDFFTEHVQTSDVDMTVNGIALLLSSVVLMGELIFFLRSRSTKKHNKVK